MFDCCRVISPFTDTWAEGMRAEKDICYSFCYTGTVAIDPLRGPLNDGAMTGVYAASFNKIRGFGAIW